MTLARLSLLLLFSSPCLLAQATPAQMEPVPDAPQPQLAGGPPLGAMVVYVSDFDLDVVVRKPRPRQSPPVSSRSVSGRRSTSSSTSLATGPKSPSSAVSSASRTSSGPDASTEETPADRANALVNQVSESLIRALTEAGYDARRLPYGTALPKVGLRLRGVFAEADEQNRARRLLVGGEPVSPNMILFVGVNNLAHPEQPLYELADPPYPDPRHGPVITVSSYVPAARYELSREPSDDELSKISADIAASLAALVNANRLSLAQ